MERLPEFVEAVESFQRFLEKEGLPVAITWVFRDDTWFLASDRLAARSKPTPGSPDLAAKVYEEGRIKGLVEVTAIGHTDSRTLATVWFPKVPGEDVQGWDTGLKVAVRVPCPVAIRIPGIVWAFLRWSPGFRRYQRTYLFSTIGTLKWAAA